MDTYPPEFVIHLQPTLVVTGLTSVEEASHHGSTNPTQTNSDTPPPPPPPPRPGAHAASGSSLEAQKAALLHAMLERNNVSYWDNTKGLAGSLFYVVPEHRSYILPPTRKFLQQTGQQHLFQSSLSPFSPSSPLYPDGLVSPLWVRRHREQIPSVFIAIVDLWDRESIVGNENNGHRAFSDKGPLGVIDPMEREHDIVLAQELLERRKAAQDRLVKFAAVIILQRSHMEDPSIEDRLNFVRKSAGLDIKNSFYVLPPSNKQEISDFAVNLQRSQYEGSMNYYKEQVKRHKKKKSNLPATTASVRPVQQQSVGGPQQTQQQQLQQQQGISVQGWMLRYEFKMGMFSECKQDIDNAVKHYESAYGLLIDMFAVTSTITPGAPGLQARTKRWAEAKVLADCLCLKICKFHLYLDAPSTALFVFRRHLIVFKAFSESWRMGDDSFEYWAWLGKQYRVFGDLLEIGTKLGLKLPAPTPGSVVYGSFAGMSEGSKDLNKFSGIGLGSGTTGFGIGPGGDAFVYGGNVGGGRGGGTHGPGAGINPILVLQHAGFFYHQAANCSVQRRLRFEAAEEAYPDSDVAPVPTASKPYPPSLQSMNAERTIDHLALTIELLTKSYEQFKRYKAGRMTLFLASEIAGTYYTAGKFEMALKFFERIGKTYRKEGWTLILTSILKWSVQCAKELGYWENVVEFLIELLSPDMPSTEVKRQSVFDELVSILYTDIHPANTTVHKPLVLSMPQINSFVGCAIQFQKRQAFVSSESRFQVQLSTQGGQGALPKPFRISFVYVEFSDATLNHRFEDPRSYTQEDTLQNTTKVLSTKDQTGRTIDWIDCTQCLFEQDNGDGTADEAPKSSWKKNVNLDILPFGTKVLEGIIVPANEQELKIVKVTLGIVTDHWNVRFEFPSLDVAQEQENGVPQHHLLSQQNEPLKRQWLEISESREDSAPKLRFKSLDKGARHLSSLRVIPRESKVEIRTLFKSPAYLDEYFPIKIRVRNGETCSVAMEMDVELQPIDPTIESLDSIVLDAHAAAESLSSGRLPFSQTLPGIHLSASIDGINMQAEKEEIAVGAWAEQTVFVKAFEIPTPRTIVCKVRYEISLDKDQKKTWTEKQHSFRVLFIPPFDAEVDYIPQLARVAASCHPAEAADELPSILKPIQVDDKHGEVLIPALTQKEMYLMSTRINNEGPWPVEVKEVRLITASSVDDRADGLNADKETSATGGLARSYSIRTRERKKSLQEVGVHVDLVESGIFNPVDQSTQCNSGEGVCVQQWQPGSLQTFNYLIQVVAADLELVPEQIDVGFLRIEWRRTEEGAADIVPYSVTNVPLQPLPLPRAEVYMTTALPKVAYVNKPFTARYEIHNPTGKLHELAMTVEPSEGMVYAGTMQATIKLLPYSSHPLQMSCYPLSAGLVRLPRVKLVVNKRKPATRRGKSAPPAPQQGAGLQEEVLVKVRGAIQLQNPRSPSTTATTEAVVIFVKPESGLIK
ncbi:Foie gras liver health family 1-domain-containing protein [Gamsiella multidivaricata]|uniref:Foie gras liver health family 1-domain-containing protein n=1 Tax=Gamsiella multidivaricata TaxID=101098 RepID=UPI00221EC548|nr:Foie gras liver health family 1-domain-containing protein [Gamsiella multidivaricata]KAG0364056.1 hypothetical protein BGZ54_007887 [Gamsiella multidivaricata]KAI7828736.1 Foie gras liver health family 1-domain-containing protein [Gamsiella multidivaricata]